jgi:uncharacterized protein YoaH (UPF0181 family)
MQRTAINIPENVGGLLAALNNAQRQRFSGRMDALRSQGVSPGDAWQVSASQQRQADLPTYEPVGDEQAAIERATAQLEGRGADIKSGQGLERTLETATEGASDTAGDAGGIGQDESLAQAELPQVEDEPPTAAPLPRERPGTPSRERRTEALSGDGDGETDTGTDSEDDQAATAESILGNAQQFLDTAIAAGLVDEDAETGAVRAANQSYVLTRDRQGKLTVENRETGGRVSGDENGVSESHGLTEADQQSWLAYGQVNADQLQQEQRQEQRRQRQHRSDLEL